MTVRAAIAPLPSCYTDNPQIALLLDWRNRWVEDETRGEVEEIRAESEEEK